jgi:predicted SnoaL-like aldol condensation-catalyzing enzyme
MPKPTIATALALSLIASGCAYVAPVSSQLERKAPGEACTPSTAANRDIVLQFYNLGLSGLQPRAAFERFVSPQFVEHKPDVPAGTREGTIDFLEQLIADVPEPHWEILRTVAEGDLVFVHARFTPAAGAPAYAVADVFRLQDCLIVEHWDVVSGPPQQQRNPNPRF